jgi:hypothetical protein
MFVQRRTGLRGELAGDRLGLQAGRISATLGRAAAANAGDLEVLSGATTGAGCEGLVRAHAATTSTT